MADLPISGLPSITVPSNSYSVAAVSASVTSQMTLAQVAAAMSSSFTASQAISASYATSASYEINYETSSSYADTASIAVSASYALSASYAISASYAPISATASYVASASYTTTASYAESASYATTSSNSISSSYALTSSYAISASYAPDNTFPFSGSARITGSLGLTGSLGTSGSVNLNGALYIQSSSLFSENTGSSLVSYDTASGQLFHTPYSSALPALFAVGAFYSTGSITTTANQSGSFTYSTSLGINSISITSGSRIMIDRSATYNLQFSIQIHNQSSGADIAVWLKKNGLNVADTATYVTVPSNQKDFVALNLWDTAVNGDYYELAYQATESGVVFETIAATGNIPQSPSIILTVNQVR